MILLLGFPLLTRAGTVDSTRVANREVRGKVIDEKKQPIPGVSVRLGGTSMGTATDVDGKFKLLIPADTATLVVSFIGMKTEIVKIPRLKTGVEQKELTIVLREEDVKLEDVVVTGIFTRKKESFTGSASTYSAAELKTMGTQNVLQSLKTLDPAFAIIEDNQFGSTRTACRTWKSGKVEHVGLRDELDADPNQPLFILDGFESTLAAINDLDINRVASITI
ncbi:MAG: carboxypeptidase-like regulatory domain-containing protein [Butyricimonas paravirosa]